MKTRSPQKRETSIAKKAGKWIRILLLILVLSCLFSVWISYHWLTISRFTVRDSKIAEPFRIVLISDLHNHQFGSRNVELIAKIRDLDPDFIVLDGDILNGDSRNDEVAVNLVEALSHLTTVYYSYGNHEKAYRKAGHDSLQEDLEKAGAVVLEGQFADVEVKGNSIRLGGLYEYGFKTSMQTEEENESALSYLEEYTDTDSYLIMCAHRPESFYCWDYADTWGIDLVLSGHLHGGQVILPGLGGLYSSLEGFFPPIDYGQYKLGDSDMIVTRGLGSSFEVLPRFNNPPEIVLVEVEPER